MTKHDFGIYNLILDVLGPDECENVFELIVIEG